MTIIIYILLLLAYVFDITASKTKITSVILLLLLGFSVKIITENINISVPYLNLILSILGTIGLILIALEGSLELEINKADSADLQSVPTKYKKRHTIQRC